MRTLGNSSAVILAILLLVNSLFLAGCGESKTTTHKIATYTAQADAALVAITDSVDRLRVAGRVKDAAAKTIYQTELRIVGAVDQIRDRAKTGYEKKDALSIITASIEDLRKAEAEGVLGLSGKEKDQFLQITFFGLFSLNSLKAVIEASKEPTIPQDQVAAAARGTKSRAADETVWTDLVLILQTATIRGISQSRMTADEAFADGAALSVALKESLNSKIAAL